MNYASFWRRFGAYWLDVVILLPLTGLTFWLGDKSRLFYLYYFIPGFLFGLWFHIYLVRKYGGTPGKLLLRIKIAKVDGSSVGYKEAVIRYAVLFALSTLISVAFVLSSFQMSDAEYFSLGFRERSIRLVEQAPFWYNYVQILLNVWVWSEFIVMLTNKQRRAVHDYMAGTVVVRTGA